MHSEGDKAVWRCGPLASPTLRSHSDKNKTGEEEEKRNRQCNGCCMKQKKEKCCGATCPLPMSHAALSPLVGEPCGRVLSPGQSATSIRPKMQMRSGEFFMWQRLDTATAGEGREERSNQRATPQAAWKTLDGFRLQRRRSAGGVGKQLDRYVLTLDFGHTIWARPGD